MGYKVLVTLDLHNAGDEQREKFYEVLAASGNWSKIINLTTSWKVSFVDDLSRDQAIEIIKKNLQKAKDDSRITKVAYALQMDKFEVIVSAL
jgi:hypothetical protein